MGAAALTRSGGGQYAIHGTNGPGSVGTFVSYGYIRMHNADILDLFNRVGVGTPVVVTQIALIAAGQERLLDRQNAPPPACPQSGARADRDARSVVRALCHCTRWPPTEHVSC